MNWLYFFMGVTTVWVFMGVGIFFGADIIRNVVFPTKRQKAFNDELIDFWKQNIIHQNEMIIQREQTNMILNDIQTSITQLKK